MYMSPINPIRCPVSSAPINFNKSGGHQAPCTSGPYKVRSTLNTLNVYSTTNLFVYLPRGIHPPQQRQSPWIMTHRNPAFPVPGWSSMVFVLCGYIVTKGTLGEATMLIFLFFKISSKVCRRERDCIHISTCNSKSIPAILPLFCLLPLPPHPLWQPLWQAVVFGMRLDPL